MRKVAEKGRGKLDRGIFRPLIITIMFNKSRMLLILQYLVSSYAALRYVVSHRTDNTALRYYFGLRWGVAGGLGGVVAVAKLRVIDRFSRVGIEA